MNKKSVKFTRREFIGTTSLATGAFALIPGRIPTWIFGNETTIRGAIYTPLSVKFIHSGVIHQEAFEGSCRWGSLDSLTMSAETEALRKGLENLKQEIGRFSFSPGIQVLEPEGVYMWVEKGNPDIMLKDQELFKLIEDDPDTDIYVVTGGLPQFICLRIAQTYKKPVIFMSSSGWGLDVPAGIRARGLESFYVQDMNQLNDLLLVFKARKAFHNTRFLNVTNFEVEPKGVISSANNMDFIKEKYGMDYHTVNYQEFFTDMDKLLKDKEIRQKAEKLAGVLINGAGASNMTKEDVINSFNFYLTVLHFFNKYNCNAFGIECFELCSSMNPWNRRFTPCMTHSLLKNDGFPSACEKDISALLSMAAMMYVSHKPAYMGNPDLDLEKNIIMLHHSDSPTKMSGFDKPQDYYEIKSFTEAGFGATLRYDYNAHKGEIVTLSRFDPSARKILVIPGEISGGAGMDGLGCSQRVSIAVKNAREAMREMQEFGHHLSLVYGNCVESIRDLGVIMGFEVRIV
jgi:L-fucose isomerase-like protein